MTATTADSGQPSTPASDFYTILQESDDPIGDLDEALSPADKRELCHPEESPLKGDTPFWLLCNLVTRSWLEGKPTEWERVPEHAMDWNDRVEHSPLNIILAGRKHTKTTFVLCKIIQKSQYIEGFSTLYWANTEKQVEDRMEELEELIEANTWLDNLHTGGEACGALKSKTFNDGAKLGTTWVEGAAEGGHVNMSIGDDPLKEFGGLPDERIDAWYSKVIDPMLNRDGLHVIVGTRKRPTDLYELLRTKSEGKDWDLPSYDLVEYPAVREPWEAKYGEERPEDLAPERLYTTLEAPTLADALNIPGDDVSILWPAGRPARWLAKRLGAQGYPAFVREFCMVYEQAEDAIIDREAIDSLCSIYDAPPNAIGDVASPTVVYDRTVVGVDPASTAGTDRSSFVVLGVRPNGIRDILWVYNAESINPMRFKSKLQELDRRYGPASIVIESNGMQQYIVDDAIEFDRSLPIKSHNTTAKKHSWTEGIPRIAGRIANGGYQFYREGPDNTEELIDALTSLVMDESDKLQGHTPDAVSALYQAEQAIGRRVSTGTIDLDEQPGGPAGMPTASTPAEAAAQSDEPTCPRCDGDLEPANREGMALCPRCDITIEADVERPDFEESELGQAIQQIREGGLGGAGGLGGPSPGPGGPFS